MSALAEFFSHPLYAFGGGLFLGLWVAVNVWIWRYSIGYRAGIRFCVEELEPVRSEIAEMAGVERAFRHHITEEMRLRMQAAQGEEPQEETRH